MIVVIPARGGSKGIPNKNIKELGGKPLIQYTIDAARELFDDDQIWVSTDSIKIKSTVENMGLKVPFIRPEHLATDKAGSYEVLLHAVREAEKKGIHPEIVILLQPTSPFRTSKHIGEALKVYNSELDMVVSVKETSANPYYVLREENDEGYLIKSKEGTFTRRQDCPKVWELNGAIYVINVKTLKTKPISEFTKIKKYVMNEFSSHDIDSMLDWNIAEVLSKKIDD